MLAELIKHGLSPRRAYNFPYYVQPADSNGAAQTWPPALADTFGNAAVSPEFNPPREVSDAGDLHLLFSGRMEYLKGGHVFIAALPEVAAALGRRLQVTFAGDGRERSALKRQAANVSNGNLEINFPGWVGRPRVEALLKNCDLLVVPSLWPEPFGLVGPEAGHYGVPVAAFNVGGIRDWLLDGVNGYLASGSPPTAGGLAQAIIKCLQDPSVTARLRMGAVEVSRQFNIENHLTALLEVFQNVANRE
jgi:glycosyltransferase involved in cell wall biosynthesis